MKALNRRFDHRVSLEMFLNAYVDDEQQRAFTSNISETGVLLHSLTRDPVPPFTPVGLEFTLPGTREIIWAGGEICYDIEDDYLAGRGVRFTAMAGLHARMLREYCFRLRRRSGSAGLPA